MASLKLILTPGRLERGSAMVVIGCNKDLIACRFNFSGFWQNQHRIAEGIKAIVRSDRFLIHASNRCRPIKALASTKLEGVKICNQSFHHTPLVTWIDKQFVLPQNGCSCPDSASAPSKARTTVVPTAIIRPPALGSSNSLTVSAETSTHSHAFCEVVTSSTCTGRNVPHSNVHASDLPFLQLA